MAPVSQLVAPSAWVLGRGRRLRFSAVDSLSFPSADTIGSQLAAAVPGTVGWTLLTLLVGAFLVAVLEPSAARRVADAAIETPGPPFAVGFVVLFTPLTLAAIALVGGNPLPDPYVRVAALASLPPSFVGLCLLAVGTPLGVLIAGRWIGRKRWNTGPWRSLLLGTALLAPTQFVPVLGYLVTVGAATIGCGSLTLELYTRRDRSIETLDRLLAGSGPNPDRDRWSSPVGTGNRHSVARSGTDTQGERRWQGGTEYTESDRTPEHRESGPTPERREGNPTPERTESDHTDR